jgi:hypothetical protein
MKIHPQAKKECCKSNEDRTNGAEHKLLFHNLKIPILWTEAIPRESPDE